MKLTLRIESAQAGQLGASAFTFGPDGGTVGRSPAATWSLPDPRAVLSGQHMRIGFADGAFTLTDTSRNGVFVNGGSEPLGSGATHRLKDGDVIRISDYDMVAHVAGGAVPVPVASLGPGRGFGLRDEPPGLAGLPADPVDTLPAAQPRVAQPQVVQPRVTLLRASRPQADDDLLADLFDGSSVPADSLPAPNATPAATPVVTPAATIPAAAPAQAGLIPEDWMAGATAPNRPRTAQPAAVPAAAPTTLELLQKRNAARNLPPPAPAPASPFPASPAPASPFPASPAPPGAGSAAASEASARFWAALGLDPGQIPADQQAAFAEELGRALRATLENLIRTMHLRATTKTEFNVEQTMVRPTENNLFKFASDPDELLSLAMTSRNRMFLPLPEAVAGAFDDIQASEAVTLSAVQVSLRSLIDRFHPDKVTEQVRAQKGVRRLFHSLRARCWEHFKASYASLASDANEAANRLFEVEFARAYRDRPRRPNPPR